MNISNIFARIGSFGVLGLLREKEIEYQKEEYKRTGVLICSGSIATEDYIANRIAEIQRRIAAEEKANGEGA
jgi:hypothetical protein